MGPEQSSEGLPPQGLPVETPAETKKGFPNPFKLIGKMFAKKHETPVAPPLPTPDGSVPVPAGLTVESGASQADSQAVAASASIGMETNPTPAPTIPEPVIPAAVTPGTPQS